MKLMKEGTQTRTKGRRKESRNCKQGNANLNQLAQEENSPTLPHDGKTYHRHLS
jgi:hypothetical protein